MRMKKQIAFHPLLFAMYPILNLFGQNLGEVAVIDALRPLAILLVGTGLALLLLRGIVKDWAKAGLIVSLSLLWFFSYAHLYRFFKGADLAVFAAIGRHRYLAPASVLLILLILVFSLRKLQWPNQVTSFLNVAAIVAIAFPMISIISYNLQPQGSASTTSQDQVVLTMPEGTAPDIYYIILDSYARDDMLRDVFGYDNTPFLDALEERGFYIARDSWANFGRTSLSLSSSLNMQYLQTLIPDLNPDSEQKEPLWDLIQQSSVRHSLEAAGYITVAFSTGYPGTELKDADVYITGGMMDQLLGMNAFNSFEGMLIDNSALKLFFDGAIVLPTILPDLQYPFDMHREWILNVFHSIGNLPETDQPKFVFAHIISPHSPYVFNRDGSPVERPSTFTFGFTFGGGEALTGEAYIQAYRDQLHYINHELLNALDAILASSPVPPVIIVQADHGPIPEGSARPYPEQRMAILNAYYLPPGVEAALYPSITPVNSFRVVFNALFDAQMELLEDRIFISEHPKIFDFKEISEQLH